MVKMKLPEISPGERTGVHENKTQASPKNAIICMVWERKNSSACGETKERDAVEWVIELHA